MFFECDGQGREVLRCDIGGITDTDADAAPILSTPDNESEIRAAIRHEASLERENMALVREHCTQGCYARLLVGGQFPRHAYIISLGMTAQLLDRLPAVSDGLPLTRVDQVMLLLNNFMMKA